MRITKCWTEAPVGPFQFLETVLAGDRSTSWFLVQDANPLHGNYLCIIDKG